MHTNKIHRQQELSNFYFFLIQLLFRHDQKKKTPARVSRIHQRSIVRNRVRLNLKHESLAIFGEETSINFFEVSFYFPFSMLLGRSTLDGGSLHLASYSEPLKTLPIIQLTPLTFYSISTHILRRNYHSMLFLPLWFSCSLFSRANIFFSRAFCRYRVRVSRRFQSIFELSHQSSFDWLLEGVRQRWCGSVKQFAVKKLLVGF